MISGKTKSGFSFSVDENAVNDMEFIDAIAENAENEPLVASITVKQLLGVDQRKRFYDHLRTEDGRVPVDAVAQELEDIYAIIGQSGKNS